MRSPAGAVLWSLIGTAFAVPGILLATWVALRQFRIQWAYDWVFWIVTHSGIPLTLRPGQVANIAIETPWAIFAGVCAFLSCVLAVSSLRAARLSMRAPDESRDGKARLALKSEPLQVGQPVEGGLLLAKDPGPGELFVVRLRCSRLRSGDEPTQQAYYEEQRTPANRGAHGWSVPFRFEVPVTAPPTGEPSLLQARGYQFQWELELTRAKSWSPFSTQFDLVLRPAPAEALRALEAREAPEVTAAADALTPIIGMEKLPPFQREQLKALSPEELAMMRKLPGRMVWVVVAFFAFFLGIPILVFVGMFVVAALRQP